MRHYEKVIYKRTGKGNELLKIVRALEKFKRDYPKDCSRALEFVGIYDERAIIRILKRIEKKQKKET